MGFDKEKIKQNFSRGAATYDYHADMHEQITSKFFSGVVKDYRRILDVGCGTGSLVERLSNKYPMAQVLGIDISPNMIDSAVSKVKRKNVKFIVGDGEALPFGDSKFDLVVSSSSLQWMNPEKVFAEASRVLEPQGEFYFSTFGPATLCELRKVGLAVNDFPSKGNLEVVLSKFFERVGLRSEFIFRDFKNVFDFFSYLKKIGAQYSNVVKGKGLLTKRKISSLFPHAIRVTFEVYYGSCVKSSPRKSR